MVSYYLPSTKLLVRGRKLVKMRYESYAQELEDIILYVALQDVDEGFYIDIGANDPIEISVTKFFYDRGWSGINVEPLRSKCALLENERPRDINLCIGISDRRGETAVVAAGSGSTFSDKVAQNLGYSNNNKYMKTTLTLSDIFEKYCNKNQQIHFCKIDVEGYEKQVLEGVNDWNVYRPWIFVIEAVEPGTSIPAYELWEDILLKNGYVLAYKTGINRYYLDKRKEHLMERFGEIQKFVSENSIVKMEMTDVDAIKILAVCVL